MSISRIEADKHIVEDIETHFNPDDDEQLKFIKFLLLKDSFTCKKELSGLLIKKSNEHGYSIIKRLLWV